MGTFFSSSSYSYYPPLLSGLIYVHVEQSIFWASTAQIISNAARAAGSIRFISFHPLSSWVTNQPSTKKKPGWIFFSLLLLLLFSFSFLITHIINKLVEGIFWAPSKSFTLLVWEKQRQRQKKQKNKNKNKKNKDYLLFLMPDDRFYSRPSSYHRFLHCPLISIFLMFWVASLSSSFQLLVVLRAGTPDHLPALSLSPPSALSSLCMCLTEPDFFFLSFLIDRLLIWYLTSLASCYVHHVFCLSLLSFGLLLLFLSR